MQDRDLQEFRKAELEAALRYFPAGCRVLELGGGTGWQARLMAERGFQVESVDVELHPPENSFFPVRQYDGVHLPFPDESFDVVFSSNVMEHVTQRAALGRDVLRVCRAHARVIHILPNPCWRFFTLLGFYPYKLKRVFAVLCGGAKPASAGRAAPKAGPRKALRHQMLYDAAHGEFPSAFAELWYFSSLYWRRALARDGLMLEKCELAGDYWYHGYFNSALVPLSARRRIPRWLGRPCTLYLLRKP